MNFKGVSNHFSNNHQCRQKVTNLKPFHSTDCSDKILVWVLMRQYQMMKKSRKTMGSTTKELTWRWGDKIHRVDKNRSAVRLKVSYHWLLLDSKSYEGRACISFMALRGTLVNICGSGPNWTWNLSWILKGESLNSKRGRKHFR